MNLHFHFHLDIIYQPQSYFKALTIAILANTIVPVSNCTIFISIPVILTILKSTFDVTPHKSVTSYSHSIEKNKHNISILLYKFTHYSNKFIHYFSPIFDSL